MRLPLPLLSAVAAIPAAAAMVLRDPISKPAAGSASGPTGGGWTPASWRTKEAKQIPVYPDQAELKRVEEDLASVYPLVFAGEIRNLSEQLAAASMGEAFVLFGGDCAESFDEFSVDHIRDTFRVILQMAVILTYGGSKPVVKIGRMAGQFAKPRSSPTETIDGVTLPSYQGDNINREEPFTAEARQADPNRMVEAYNQCTQTLNILRAFSGGGVCPPRPHPGVDTGLCGENPHREPLPQAGHQDRGVHEVHEGGGGQPRGEGLRLGRLLHRA